MLNYRKISFLIILLLFTFTLSAQNYHQLIVDATLNKKDKAYNTRKVDFGFAAHQKWNPLTYVLGGTMFVYQKIISPQFSAGCLYEPSCSDFSKQLIAQYGLFKGTLASADRLMRCNRLGGYDIEAHQINPITRKIPEDISIYIRNQKKKK
jgi:putative membrane protein insertion efficiency factor